MALYRADMLDFWEIVSKVWVRCVYSVSVIAREVLGLLDYFRVI